MQLRLDAGRLRSHFNGRPWGADTSSYNMTSSINPTYRLEVLNHSTDTRQVGWSKVRSGGLFTHPTRTGKIPGTCRSRTIQGRTWWSFRPSYVREQVEGAPGTRLESVWSQGDSSAAPQQVLIQLCYVMFHGGYQTGLPRSSRAGLYPCKQTMHTASPCLSTGARCDHGDTCYYVRYGIFQIGSHAVFM